MTDKEKLDAIRAEIHRIVAVRGYDIEMANDLFTFIDSLPNEPVSEELERASKEWLKPQLDKSYGSYGEGKMMELTHFDGYAMLDAIEFGANWQKLQDMGITNKAQDVVANLLSSADNPLDAYATEVAFVMLPATLKESYHHTNRDRIGDAVKLGAKWKENHLWKPADGDDLPDIDREVIALLDNGEVMFAHRPHKGKYIGKSLTTGNIETFENETYDKGGWNIPNVKYWLDVELPKK